MKLHKIKKQNLHLLKPLFDKNKPNFLIDTVLEGHMGSAFSDNKTKPSAARLEYADVVILGGNPNHPTAKQVIADLPKEKGIIAPPDGWPQLLKDLYQDKLISVTRQSFSNEDLELNHLNRLQESLPEGFIIKRINIELAQQIYNDKNLISEDHVHNFDSPQDFIERGIGFCVLHNERIVAGASSYAICNKGIAVQVNSHPDFRGKGLATAVSATLLAHCLKQNIIPEWDAGNEISVKLAKKLGYTPTDTYEVFVIIS